MGVHVARGNLRVQVVFQQVAVGTGKLCIVCVDVFAHLSGLGLVGGVGIVGAYEGIADAGSRIVCLQEGFIVHLLHLFQLGHVALAQALGGNGLFPLVQFALDHGGSQFQELILGDGTGKQAVFHLVHEAVGAVEDGELVLADGLEPDALALVQSSAVEVVAEFARSGLFAAVFAPQTVVGGIVADGEVVSCGPAGVQGGACGLASEMAALFMGGVHVQVACGEAVGDGADVHLTCQHTGTDACIVGDTGIHNAQVLDDSLVGAAEQSGFLGIADGDVQVVDNVVLTVKGTCETGLCAGVAIETDGWEIADFLQVDVVHQAYVDVALASTHEPAYPAQLVGCAYFVPSVFGGDYFSCLLAADGTVALFVKRVWRQLAGFSAVAVGDIAHGASCTVQFAYGIYCAMGAVEHGIGIGAQCLEEDGCSLAGVQLMAQLSGGSHGIGLLPSVAVFHGRGQRVANQEFKGGIAVLDVAVGGLARQAAPVVSGMVGGDGDVTRAEAVGHLACYQFTGNDACTDGPGVGDAGVYHAQVFQHSSFQTAEKPGLIIVVHCHFQVFHHMALSVEGAFVGTLRKVPTVIGKEADGREVFYTGQVNVGNEAAVDCLLARVDSVGKCRQVLYRTD